jgi:hypothetical protein
LKKADEPNPLLILKSRSQTPPIFISEPVITAVEDESYIYAVQTEDIEGDRLKINGSGLPEWLDMTDNGDGTAILEGIPGGPEVGDHSISLEVSDGELR